MKYTYSFLLSFLFFSFFLSPLFGQQLSFDLPESIVYQCPTPVEIRIDSQWKDIIWAAVSVSLSGFAEIVWLIPDPRYTMTLWHILSWNNNMLSGAVFVYPGTIKWQQRYGTLWIQQNNTIPTVELSFLRNVTWDQWDGVDIFAYWWKDILQVAKNTALTFIEWECLYELPASFATSWQNLDDFNTALQQVVRSEKQNIWSKKNIIMIWFAFLLLLLLLFFLYKKKKTVNQT